MERSIPNIFVFGNWAGTWKTRIHSSKNDNICLHTETWMESDNTLFKNWWLDAAIIPNIVPGPYGLRFFNMVAWSIYLFLRLINHPKTDKIVETLKDLFGENLQLISINHLSEDEWWERESSYGCTMLYPSSPLRGIRIDFPKHMFVCIRIRIYDYIYIYVYT